jgi:TonB-dependent receptor
MLSITSRGRVASWTVTTVVLLSAIAGTRLAAQGTINGRVVDTAGAPVAGAIIHLRSTPFGGRTDSAGNYRVPGLPAGSYVVTAHAAGFADDSFPTTLAGVQIVQHDFRLRSLAVQLNVVRITASPRLNETVDLAREKQKDAPNLVDVLSGDEIRALPALNAAEAAERIPGVTTERDEGEGKFIQIRGTEPTLQNVTVDGAHIPGTLQYDRSVKLDDIPSDVIGAIEVSKTLTADMDADAIGGSVNIVSKVPEGRPRGYISAQYGLTTPTLYKASSDNFGVGQGSLFYGGRFGADQKLGFLIGGSVDRNDRPISDMEPSWATTSGSNVATGSYFPNSIDSRIYRYFRQRYGVDGNLDYRFDDQTNVFLRGLYSQFLNHGYRYVYNVSANTDGPDDYGIDGTASKNISNRTPIEQLYGVTTGLTKNNVGPFRMELLGTAGGTASSQHNYRFSTFNFNGPVQYQFDNANVIKPKFFIRDPHLQAALDDPANWSLANYNATNNLATGLDLGGAVNMLYNYTIGKSTPSLFRFGVKYRNEQKGFQNHSVRFSNNSSVPITMAQLLGGLSDPNYYHNVFPVDAGPFASIDRTTAFENANPALFSNVTDTLRNAAGNYFGREQIFAGYVENRFDLGAFQLDAGLRVEQTKADYRGNVLSQSSLTTVGGSNTYTDVFPSAQLRYEVDANTNLRAAITRGIARPAYNDLAPHLTGDPVGLYAHPYLDNTLSTGNPNLKAETAWNYDLLAEHFMPHAGVVSGGIFYKDLANFIYTQRFFNYQGPVVAFRGANGTEPRNGQSAYLYGFEADYNQHLTFLPGALAGLGFDLNWTHVESRTSYVTGDSVVVDGTGKPTGQVITFKRHFLLPRTSPNIANASLLYDFGRVSARLAWVYQGAMLASTGGNPAGDGTSSAVSGDNYFYAHSQIDASIQYNYDQNTTVQFQVLNMNNAVFGFFNGTFSHEYDVQREYYGPTFYLGIRRGF